MVTVTFSPFKPPFLCANLKTMQVEITRLNLVSPLYFDPGAEEKLFYFELDEAQYRNFEPDKAVFLMDSVSGTELPGRSAKMARLL